MVAGGFILFGTVRGAQLASRDGDACAVERGIGQVYTQQFAGPYFQRHSFSTWGRALGTDFSVETDASSLGSLPLAPHRPSVRNPCRECT
jgi:hypothetical protein